MKKIVLMAVTIVLITMSIIPLAFRESSQKRFNDKRLPIFCAPSFDPAKLKEKGAPLFKGLGSLHFDITTTSSLAQKYFDQGLTLIYAFNHGEAGRSFQEAIRLDSTCAMAWWGMGMVLGPNYNAALNPSSLQEINEALSKAVKYSATASPQERGLINALAKRFPATAVKDMTPYNAAYAAAMKELHDQFPREVEIAVLTADALMNEHPWNLWLKDGTAQPWTPAIVQLLELTLEAAPDHPGAIHAYIHAIEASRHAAKALPVADRLGSILPSAGHIVHMPSHIYLRTGHYHKGVLVNEKASMADSTYIAQCKVQGVYPLIYYPHNIHFLAACAFLEGNSKKAMEAAWSVSRNADRKYLAESISVQHFYVIPYYTMVHLGKWEEILALSVPGESLKYPVAIRHYARGMAFAAKGMPEALRELELLQQIAGDESLRPQLIWEMNSVLDVINIAALVLEGEIKAQQKQYDQSVVLLQKAVAIEDQLNYIEPPDWFFSVRHTLGHVLVQAGRFAEAEKVYEEDMINLPENGWALAGLYNSLKGQDKQDAAAAVKKRFNKAWQWADITISSSRKY